MKVAVLLLVALAFVSCVSIADARQPHHKRHPRDSSSSFMVAEHPDDHLRMRMVQIVNNMNTTWTAAVPKRFKGTSMDSVKRQLGALDAPVWERPPVRVNPGFDLAALPESFDARTEWPNCPTIQEVRDQSDCGSCWAFGAVEAASDRICIETKGANKAHLSAEDMVGCCTSCGFGCNGGYPGAAWNYLAKTGVVSGGNYGDFSSCSSYSLPNCAHHTNKTTYPACGQTEYPTPACPNKCDSNSSYPVPFGKDKFVFSSAYSVPSDPLQIQHEIMTNGPVEVAFQVYADFMNYAGGVYQHVSGNYLGGHAVKMLGWGVENGTPYWLLANSWNESWGEDGFFRILRGSNHCGVEGSIVAGKFL